MSFISYAQNFEDFMLWRALKHVKNGFYIDVGAYDPTEHSVTKYFYDNDWSGINIDPVTLYYKNFLIERPRDTNLNLLISDKEGETIFYENNKTGISSSVEENIEIWEKESSFKFDKLKKIAKTLDTVCAENEVKIVHFLKIDVEGFELNVLKGFSFKTVRPWIVLFEAVASTGNHEDISADCVSYLKSKKYHQVYFDGLNKFFVADEHKEKDSAFLAPLNIFDNSQIQLPDSHWLIHENLNKFEQASQKKIEGIIFEKQQIIDKVEIELDSTKTQLDSTKTQLDSTKTQLDSTKTQLDLRVNELKEIYSCRGWRILVFIRKVYLIIFPYHSIRRRTARLIWIALRNPSEFFKKIVRKIKGLFKVQNKNLITGSGQASTPNISKDLDNLSPRTRKIYTELKTAIERRNKNK